MKPVVALVPLLWNNVVLSRSGLGIRGRTSANAAFATGLGLLAPQSVPWFSAKGVRWGIAAASVSAGAYALLLSIEPLRASIAQRTGVQRTDREYAEWILVHIPIGTVYSEELIFRKTMQPLLGIPATAALFGLWHVRSAQLAGDSVAGTVTLTAAGGGVFGWLQHRTGSVIAPALLHLSINVCGAIAARIALEGGDSGRLG